MRILPMNLYTDRVRQRHGAPTPHVIGTFLREGDRVTPCVQVTDLDGSIARVPVSWETYQRPDMPTLTDAATYLLDMLRGEA